MLELNWKINISYSYREANRCSDGLAELAFTLLTDFQFHDVCPKFIKSYFDDDASGITPPRLVTM
jgi:hypothetical protein